MAISSVVTLGFSVSGGFQAGTTTLPTIGYTIGEVIISDSEGIEYKAPGRRMHAIATAERMQAKSVGRRMHFTHRNE